MIAGVLSLSGGRGPHDMLALLTTRAGGDIGSSRVSVQGSIGLMAGPGSPPGQIETHGRIAWIGGLGERLQGEPPWPVRGEFALIGAGTLGDELWLGRGEFGGRPLFYALEGGSRALVASSRFGPLASTLEHATVDVERLAAYALQEPLFDSARTFYKQIRRVPSATVLRVGLDGVRKMDPIPFDASPERDRSESVTVLAREVRDTLRGAVERAIAHLDDVGVIVSGGLDSSSLLALSVATSRKFGRPRIHAFNVQFAGRGDDRPHLAAVCRSLGIVPDCITADECNHFVLNSFLVDGAPLGWPTCPFNMRLIQRGREHNVDVLMTGVGGDELFNGDLRLFANQARRGHLLSSFRSVATLKALGFSSFRSRVRSLLLLPAMRAAVPRSIWRTIRRERRKSRTSWAGPALLRLIGEDAFDDQVSQDKGLSSPYSWLLALSRSAHFMNYRESRAQLELVGGCTLVEPFFDESLVRLVASVRPELLFHGGWTRGLFREAMRGVIPETVRMRPDKADFEPVFNELAACVGGLGAFDPWVKMTALADLGLVEPRAFRRRFNELRERPLDGGLWVELWPPLAAEAFAQHAQHSAGSA
jgi:asparagine synthase (glutamine-hydrolysing)